MKFDYSFYKSNELWLQDNYDENHDVVDNSPKLALVLAVDWNFINQRPKTRITRRLVDTPKTTYYRVLYTTIYLGYYVLSLDFSFKRMPYTNLDEYLGWRKNEKK